MDKSSMCNNNGNLVCSTHFLDIIPARIACYDPDLKLLWVNDHTASLLGRSKEELLGMTCCEIWQNCTQPEVECHMTLARKTGVQQKAELGTQDGRTWLLQAFPEYDENNKLSLIYEYGQDITERKKVEKLEKDIQAIMRHDLRSPAISNVYAIQMMRRSKNLSEDQINMLEELDLNARKMMETIDSSMTLYRIECGEYEPALEKADCIDLTKKTAHYVKNITRKNDVDIETHAASSGEAGDFSISCEPSLLRTALTNLIKNAVEASDTGKDVHIYLTKKPKPKIDIFNSGAIPHQIRDKFFEKFSTFGKSSGNGLGAWSAQKMIEAQGGSVSMQTSDENGGWTNISVELPEEGQVEEK